MKSKNERNVGRQVPPTSIRSLTAWCVGVLLALSLISLASPRAKAASLVSPQFPVAGGRVTVLVARAKPASDAALRCTGPTGVVAVSAGRNGNGPPGWWFVSFHPAKAGAYRCQLMNGQSPIEGVEIEVLSKAPAVRTKVLSAAWEATRGWSSDDEALYSAWIEVLFDAPEGTAWKGLDQVTSDSQRNLLHNHLGLNEDAPAPVGLQMSPDCIENPYFLRAYFSWKLALPFGFHRCKTRLGGRGPSCKEWVRFDKPPLGKTRLRAFQALLGEVGAVIHSGAGRTPLKESVTDLYPVALQRETLAPGTVYADPYGHTLTLVKWIPQTAQTPGVLLSVDAQPDGTIQIKRFWQGNFLFTTEVPGGPGFKRFRPIMRAAGRKKSTVPWRYPSNRELTNMEGFAPYSDIQSELTATDFFDQMDALINPIPQVPEAVFHTLHEALLEQLKVRVQSVENGEEWKRRNGYPTISMPNGAAIFQTGGPWEDFSTPSRDLRLLLALDSLEDFPAKLQRTPGAFVLPAGSIDALGKTLLQKAKVWQEAMSFEYKNSDGNPVKLTLAHVIERRQAFEMAYNPNDCAEIRWGAPDRSTEMATCKHRRPKDQEPKMKKAREWFQQRRRPAW